MKKAAPQQPAPSSGESSCALNNVGWTRSNKTHFSPKAISEHCLCQRPDFLVPGFHLPAAFHFQHLQSSPEGLILTRVKEERAQLGWASRCLHLSGAGTGGHVPSLPRQLLSSQPLSWGPNVCMGFVPSYLCPLILICFPGL